MAQLLLPIGRPDLAEAFEEFHEKNPGVYDWLREKALILKSRGRAHYGIGALCEAFRFHVAMTTTDPDFKLNNNHRAFYARLLMQNEPGLDGFFETRASVADEVK